MSTFVDTFVKKPKNYVKNITVIFLSTFVDTFVKNPKKLNQNYYYNILVNFCWQLCKEKEKLKTILKNYYDILVNFCWQLCEKTKTKNYIKNITIICLSTFVDNFCKWLHSEIPLLVQYMPNFPSWLWSHRCSTHRFVCVCLDQSHFLARRCSQIESTNQELRLGNKTLRRSPSFRWFQMASRIIQCRTFELVMCILIASTNWRKRSTLCI